MSEWGAERGQTRLGYGGVLCAATHHVHMMGRVWQQRFADVLFHSQSIPNDVPGFLVIQHGPDLDI